MAAVSVATFCSVVLYTVLLSVVNRCGTFSYVYMNTNGDCVAIHFYSYTMI